MRSRSAGPAFASWPRNGTASTESCSAGTCLRAHFGATTLGGAVTGVVRTKLSRSEALRASRAHRPVHLVHGTWRSRVRHRPDPGGGAGGGRPEESAPLVLLADDERSIRAICRVNLEGDGLAVLEAKDGAEALEELRREQPALLLLDVMMPGV